MSEHFVAVLQFNLEHGIWQCFKYTTFDGNGVRVCPAWTFRRSGGSRCSRATWSRLASLRCIPCQKCNLFHGRTALDSNDVGRSVRSTELRTNRVQPRLETSGASIRVPLAAWSSSSKLGIEGMRREAGQDVSLDYFTLLSFLTAPGEAGTMNKGGDISRTELKSATAVTPSDRTSGRPARLMILNPLIRPRSDLLPRRDLHQPAVPCAGKPDACAGRIHIGKGPHAKQPHTRSIPRCVMG